MYKAIDRGVKQMNINKLASLQKEQDTLQKQEHRHKARNLA